MNLLIASGLFSSKEEGFSVAISRGFLKIPGTIKDDIRKVGNVLYHANSILKPDVDLITLEGNIKRKNL